MAKIELTEKFQEAANISPEQRAVIEALLNGKKFDTEEISEKTTYEPGKIEDVLIPEIINKMNLADQNIHKKTLPRKILAKIIAEGGLKIQLDQKQANFIRNGLTTRQKRILRLTAEGYTNQGIANIVSTSREAIAVQANTINRILDTPSTTQAAAMMHAIDVKNARNFNANHQPSLDHLEITGIN